MRILHLGRAAWFLPVLVFASPMLLLLAGRDRSKPPKVDEQPESAEFVSVVDRVITNEHRYSAILMKYSPRVETYVQYYRPDEVLGDVPRKDGDFLGRLSFGTEAKEVSFVGGSASVENTASGRFLHRPRMPRPHLHLDSFTGLITPHLHLDSFAVEPLAVDQDNFDRTHYLFEPVRWEYLDDIRCLADDVHPRGHAEVGAFEGRIWVEDHDYAIVRLKGTRVHPSRWNFYLHFDCWRENLQPGVWLPVYIYNQESDIGQRLRYKAETRLWGYDLTARHQQQEWTDIQVEAPAPIRDRSEHRADLSPVESQRQINMEAEQNVLDRLEKARLIAPPGPMDKVLGTVVNNLKVTNHLDSMPPVQCRVMLTSSLESFSLAYTIVVSRGLIDVLPDEASLAMILAPELAHIALGHRLDPKYTFNDRMQISDEKLLANLALARDHKDDVAADDKGIEFLQNSPYKDKLGQAGLFLRAAADAAPHVPHMFGAHLGNRLTVGNKQIRMSALTSATPALTPKSVDQIAALPLGSRVQVNAWDGTVAFTDRKAVPLVDASEKMPLRITPVIPYLRPYSQTPKIDVSARN